MDSETLEVIHEGKDAKMWITDIKYSPDGNTLAVASYDNRVYLYDVGNAYMMKLFRDYLFHQVDEQGKPVLDFGHTIGALNKLDTGSQEKIVLSSRDSKSLMVVSFADVQESLQRAFVGLLETTQQQGASLGVSPTMRY